MDVITHYNQGQNDYAIVDLYNPLVL